MIFDKKIALFHQHAEDRDSALKMLADEFVKAGVVEENFYDGILAREANFPTGLALDEENKTGVAIPHTDPEYVKETQLGFMTLDEPVVFRNMGNMEEEVKVDMMFMMAIKEAHGQVEMLMKLMGLFADDAVISRLREVDNFDDFLKIVEDAGLTLE
ncbi:MAG: PTS sugar transporter subunit IIA [Erysipelotrichaceae bacterium]|nr:PTS sugar transporter subunit IIA [Erysipelotrichaceae bacterium]MBO4538626.1 PTS sugar transporter subunit IIA [Erysipelotrichaceae bacterium]